MILPGPPPPPALREVQAVPAEVSRARVEASVVLVRSRLGGARAYQGSGVVVASGLVATNAHVAQDGAGLTVHRGGAVWPVTRVRRDASLDLCLLSVPGLMAPPVVPAPEPEGPGQEVLAVGYPGGQLAAVRGRLRGIWAHGDGRLLQSDAPTRPGSSGGGLFDAQGRLLGLTTLTFTTSPRLNFSVPWAWIEALAAREDGAGAVAPGAVDLGADLMARLAEDPRNAPAWEAAARQWVADLPGDAQAWLALGLALDRTVRVAVAAGQGLSRDRLLEAAEAYRRSLALEAHPKVWNDLGVVLDLLNQTAEAERAFEAALGLDPRYALAWFNLGGTRLNARRLPEASAALVQGLALRPDEAQGWSRLAACLRMQGQGAEAAGAFEIALRYRPLAGDLWLEYGTLLSELGRGEALREVQVRLEALDPELAARLRAALKPGRSPATPGKRGR